jgi:hypothetical protein
MAVQVCSAAELAFLLDFPERNMMHRLVILATAVFLAASLSGSAEDPNTASAAAPLVLKYHDGRPDGKKSIAGSGEMIQFTLAADSQKLKGLRLHCARYGNLQAPQEDVEVSVMSEDETHVLHTEQVPYAKFKRGESQWTTIMFKEPIAVPKSFWVILNFNAEPTKGVYVSFDTSSAGKYSKIGVPGGKSQAVNTGGDWMVESLLTKPD